MHNEYDKLRMAQQQAERQAAANKEAHYGSMGAGTSPTPMSEGPKPYDTPCRISCIELLHMRAAEFRRKAESLDRLAHALPSGLARLDPIADEFLFEMIQSLPRVR